MVQSSNHIYIIFNSGQRSRYEYGTIIRPMAYVIKKSNRISLRYSVFCNNLRWQLFSASHHIVTIQILLNYNICLNKNGKSSSLLQEQYIIELSQMLIHNSFHFTCHMIYIYISRLNSTISLYQSRAKKCLKSSYIFPLFLSGWEILKRFQGLAEA